MATPDWLQRALNYLGFGDEEYEEGDEEYEDDYRYPEPGPSVRRLERSSESQPGASVTRLQPVPSGSQAEVFVIDPKRFEDATRIADKFRENTPVVMNMQSIPPDVGRRIMDFVSGMTYALGGSMQRVGGAVFLITPGSIQPTAEAKRRWHEKGYF